MTVTPHSSAYLAHFVGVPFLVYGTDRITILHNDTRFLLRREHWRQESLRSWRSMKPITVVSLYHNTTETRFGDPAIPDEWSLQDYLSRMSGTA